MQTLMKKAFLFLAVLAIAGTGLSSCSGSDDEVRPRNGSHSSQGCGSAGSSGSTTSNN